MPERSTVRWVAVVLSTAVALWFLVYVALMAGSQFFTDDFVYLQLAAHNRVTWSWLAQDSYGHFAPMFRLIYAFVQRTGGVSWPLAAGVEAFLVMLLFLALAWFTTTLLGRRPLAIVVALAGAASVPAIRTAMWMASGVQVIGGAFCMVLCIAAFVAYLKRPHLLLLAASLAALALGLVWYERPVLTIGYLFLIRYLFLPPAWRPDPKRVLRREVLMWLPYAVEVAIYLVYRLFVFQGSPAPGKVSTAVELFVSGFLRSYLPSLVGVRLSLTSGWVEPATVLGAVVLIGAFAAVAVFRRGVWKCVVFLIATYGVNIVVQAAGRLGVAGTDPVWISRDLQYFVDPYVATLIALTLSVTLPKREPAERARRVVPAVVVLAASAIAVTTAVNWVQVDRNNFETSSHHYLNRAIAELKESGTVDLVNFKVPQSVAPTFTSPFSDYAGFFSIDATLASHLDAGSPRKVVLDANGDLLPAHPVTVGEATTAAAFSPAGNPVGAQYRATPDGYCMSGHGGVAMQVRVPGVAPVPGASVLQVTYTTTRPHALQVATVGSQPTYNASTLPLRAGTDASVVQRLDGDPTGAVWLIAPHRVRDLCVHSVWIGMVAVDTPDGCRVLDHYGSQTQVPGDCTRTWPAR